MKQIKRTVDDRLPKWYCTQMILSDNTMIDI